MKESKFSGRKAKLLFVFIFVHCFFLSGFAQNNNCANAITINPSPTTQCGTMGLASFAGATASPESDICTTVARPDVWFQFTATATAHDISLLNFPPTLNQAVVIGLYEGNVCSSLIRRFCSSNNYLTATGLVVGTVYKIRLSLDAAATDPSLTFSVCITTPTPPVSGDPLECLIKTINPGFEQPVVSGMDFVNDYTMQGWRTTATDHKIEVWTNGYVDAGGTNLGVPAYEGNQFVELNANQTSGLYQDYATPQQTAFTYSFAHRGRRGVDTMQLFAGPPGGNYLPVGPQIATGNTAWAVYTGTYTVPAGQPVTRFIFQAVNGSTGDNSIGNFLDAISFVANNGIITSSPHYLNCGATSTPISATGAGGIWSAHTDNPGPVTIADVNSENTTVSDFVETGTYRFEWSNSYCSSTLEVIYYGSSPPPPVIQDITYCVGQTPAPLSDQVQILPGFNIVWGTLDGSMPTPSTSSTGTTIYYVTQSSPSGCESFFVELNVIVRAPDSQVADFTIPPSVCSTSADVLPTLATDFATGGQFTGSNGLVIDPATGEINVTASGPGTYAVTYTVDADLEGCLSAATNTENITITNFAESIDVTFQQPTCNTSTGTITINSPTGAGFTYSINGVDFQPGTTFAGLASDTYTITVNNPSGCISAFPGYVINPQPSTPAVATVTSVQPTCPAPTGSITVTAPVGTGLTYSINGVDFETTTTFDNLTPGTYNVTVVNADGCSSVLTGVVISPVPGAPAVPVLTIVQPSCTSTTGTITVNSPTGNTLTYSINGVDFQSTTTFANVVAGTYNVTVRTTTGCESVLNNVVVNTPPSPVPPIPQPAPLEVCDDNNDGYGVFNLLPRLQEIEAAMADVTATAYETLSDANQKVNAIGMPGDYSNINPNTQTIFIGVQSNTTGCSNTTTLQLIVNGRPVIPVVSGLTLCETSPIPDGIEEFDLTLNDDAARGGDASLTVQYYLTQVDAQNNLTPITGPEAYNNINPNQQTIWVAVSNGFGCRSVSSFTIIVNPLPVLSTDPADFIATECEELPGEADFDLDQIATAVTAGSASYVVYFYQTQAQALAGGADFEPGPTYLSGDADIWARVINPTTNCVRVARVELNVIPAPIATTPAPIAECDDNNDGFARFNLTPAMQAIEAAIPDVTVSAFETQSDADLNVNVIPSPEAYDNIVAGTQTLYLRVQSDLTDCYDTVTLVLIVNPRPDAHSPAQPYALCDDGTSDTDGIAHFNLNSQSAEILAGLDPAQYTVDYYTDAAATPASLIGTPGNYPSATATVYAKVTNTATGCFYIVAVRLVVNALPVLITNEYSYSLCDTTLPANKETFDLTTTIDKFITDENLNGVAVTFHTTLADAQGGTNALTDAQAQAYENTSQVQSLYVRFTVTTTGCFRLGYLDIRVEPQPVLTLPSQDELTVCDTDGNGIGEFNLEALKETLANGDTSLVITFHLTAEEALSGANPIGNTTDYRNDHPGTQTLWVRAVSSTTGCFNTTPFPVTLIVTPAPQAPKLQDITLCDDTDNNGQDGALRTDLTVYETQIKEAVAPVEVTITYYLSQG
ncbi:hypothetical protein AMR72_17055 [Flavobacterium psychrophilum]|nr:hypothetical protein AMR72_17055 [Flavobacterium psychrophilum]AOE54063.1 hypothetical protein ALW18_17045 [Flavobacterium psychrophilum]